MVLPAFSYFWQTELFLKKIVKNFLLKSIFCIFGQSIAL